MRKLTFGEWGAVIVALALFGGCCFWTGVCLEDERDAWAPMNKRLR